MTATRHTVKILLALTCSLFIVLVPLLNTASAQNVLEKGAQGVKKGVETGVEKTKEGGQAIKRGVTGEDTSTERQKGMEQTTPSTEQQRQTTTTESKKGSTTTEKKEGKLPKTAGELPLLALVGALTLGAAGVSRILRRVKE